MKLYKPQYKDRQGKKKKCQHWYIGFTDNRQVRRRLPAFSNKRASEKAGEKIEELLSSGGILSPELQRWIENIPPKMRDKLIELGLIDGQRVSANLGKPLTEHLEDFCEGLSADKRRATYVKNIKMNIERILSGCGFNTWTDIDGNRVKTFLAKSRGQDGYGERTYNSYLAAFKGFCSWMIRENRASAPDPMQGHNLIKQTNYKKMRRALTLDESHRLLETTETASRRWKMSGLERSLVYRLALEVGLRAGEIISLSVLSFDFENKGVRIEPSDTKGKRPADLILIPETARAIREFLKGKEPTDKAFAMPPNTKTAAMLRDDLKDAGIEYTDAAGRDADFHSLRHSFVSHLALAGVHPAVAQKLARHSKIETTMKYYTHVLHTSELAAIEALRKLNGTQPKQQSKKIG